MAPSALSSLELLVPVQFISTLTAIVSAPMRFIVSALSDCGGSVSVEKPTARAGALPGSGRGTGVRCRSGAEMIVLLLLEMGILRQACTQPTSVAPLRVRTLVRVSTP